MKLGSLLCLCDNYSAECFLSLSDGLPPVFNVCQHCVIVLFDNLLGLILNSLCQPNFSYKTIRIWNELCHIPFHTLIAFFFSFAHSLSISARLRPRIWDQLKLGAGSVLSPGRRPGNTLHILCSSKPRAPRPVSQKPHKTNEDWWLGVRARLRHAATKTKEITVGIRGFPREQRGGWWWLWGKSAVKSPPCRKCGGQRRLLSPDVTRMRLMYPGCMTLSPWNKAPGAMWCFVKTRGHSLSVGSFPRLKCLEGVGGFKVIMVKHGYPCQPGSEVKGSPVIASMSRDGAPSL